MEEACKTAWRELAALEDRAECRRSLKRDQDALLEGYADLMPEAVEALESEQRHGV